MRNEFIWNSKVLPPAYVLYEALKFLSEWEIAMTKKRLRGLMSASTQVVASSWSKSPYGI